MSFVIQQLTIENNRLTDKTKYLEDKLKQIISERVREKMNEKQIKLSQEVTLI